MQANLALTTSTRNTGRRVGKYVIVFLAFLFSSEALAMGEKPEPEYKKSAREEQRIAKILDNQIVGCDPWSKLQFEVNGVLLRPQSNTVSYLRPTDPLHLPDNICKEKVVLNSFFVKIPDPKFIDTRNGRIEEPGRLTEYRKWWYEQKLPHGFEISLPKDGVVSSLEKFRNELSKQRGPSTAPVRVANFDLLAPYEGWFTPVGRTPYYTLRKSGRDLDVLGCLNQLFGSSKGVAQICGLGTLFASQKLWISYRISFSSRGDRSNPWSFPYYPEDAMQMILSLHQWTKENTEISLMSGE